MAGETYSSYSPPSPARMKYAFTPGIRSTAASASSAPIARNMVPRASASAQVGAATVTDSRRDRALRPVRGSMVWATLLPSPSR